MKIVSLRLGFCTCRNLFLLIISRLRDARSEKLQ